MEFSPLSSFGLYWHIKEKKFCFHEKIFPLWIKKMEKYVFFGWFFFLTLTVCIDLTDIERGLIFSAKTAYNIDLSFDTIKKLLGQIFTSGRRFPYHPWNFQGSPLKNEKSIFYPNIGLWHIKLKLVTSGLQKNKKNMIKSSKLLIWGHL